MKVPVIVTEQYSKGLGNTSIHQVQPQGTIQAIDKLSFSCWGDQTFRDSFKKLIRNMLMVSGIEGTCVCFSR
jgi:hypothetical protein